MKDQIPPDLAAETGKTIVLGEDLSHKGYYSGHARDHQQNTYYPQHFIHRIPPNWLWDFPIQSSAQSSDQGLEQEEDDQYGCNAVYADSDHCPATEKPLFAAGHARHDSDYSDC
jgi:hypothetical protein